jgi:AraC family transcriptional regulator, positive regulator of tynA and feaB
MTTEDDFQSEPALDYDTWRGLLGSRGVLYSSEHVERESFAGSIRARRIYGFDAVDHSSNVDRVDRTHRHARLDGMDHFKAHFQLSGKTTLIQNDRITELAVGDLGIVDVSQPFSLVGENVPTRAVCVDLPRRLLISYLGLEPNGGSCWRGDTHAGRLLFRLVLEAVDDYGLVSVSTETYMQLAVLDLLGALLNTSDLPPNSSYTDKLFVRACNIIKSHFCNPDIRPHDIAAEAGISLRYLQKLFTVRGTTCSHFIQTLRLDHAARLLHRRASMKAGQPLSEIGYACGFRDYTQFVRTFRHRFGCAPSGYEKSLEGYAVPECRRNARSIPR